MSDAAHNLKSGVDALKKQATDRLKNKGDARSVNSLVERYNFYLGKAKELNADNQFIQSLSEISKVDSSNTTIGEYTTKMEEVTYALVELDSQLSYPMYI